MHKLLNDKGLQLSVLLVVFFLFDALNVLLFKTNTFYLEIEYLSYVRFSALPKGIVFFLLLIHFFREKIGHERIVFTLLILAIVYSNLTYSNTLSSFIWMVFFIKYLLPIFLYCYFKRFNWSVLNLPRNIFLGIIIIQVTSVLIGFIFQIKSLSSYGLNRFGFSGLIFAVNEITFFYSIASIYLFFLWQRENKFVHLLILLGVICAGFLLGTKAYFLSFFIFSSFLLWFVHKRMGLLKTFLTLVLLVIPVFLILKYSSFIDFHLQIMRERGILSTLSTLRTDLIMLRLPKLYSNWSIFNFLFGGMNPQHQIVEMDLIDLFSIGGIVGSSIYLYIIFTTVFQRNINIYLLILFLNWLIIGALAGHFFNSGVNAIYLVFVSLYITNYSNKQLT